MFTEFFKKGLKIENPGDVEFVDIHRFPKHSINNHGKTFHRPIIVKLLTMSDKNLIFEKLRNLQAYNIEKKQSRNFYPYVYVASEVSIAKKTSIKRIQRSQKKTEKGHMKVSKP